MTNNTKLNTYDLDLTNLGLFSGFYESNWDPRYSGTEYSEEYEINESIEGVQDIDFTYNWDLINDEVGAAYAYYLENNLKGVKNANFKKAISPQWYNFDTDHLIISVTTELDEDTFNKQLIKFVDDFKTEYDNDLWFTEYVNYNEILLSAITEKQAYINDNWHTVEWDCFKDKYVIVND